MNIGSVRGSPNGIIGIFTNGTIRVANYWLTNIGRANGANGMIGRTFNDIVYHWLVEP